jgi:hypothetical protein
MGFNADASRIALPRGRVFFARKSAAGVLGPLLHLGNCSKLDFATIGDDIAEVTDFTSETSTPLTRISRKRAPEFPLSLYELEPNNLALVLMGNPPSEYTQVATPVTGEIMPGGAKVGGIYQTVKFGPISAITLTVGATAAVVNTNYVLRDASVGLIELILLPGSEVEGAVVTIGYTPTAYSAGSGFKRVLGGAAARIEGRLVYVGTSGTGPRHVLKLWNCSIESDGALPFIGTDPTEFGLKVTVLADPAQASPFELTEIDNGSGVPFA